MRFRNLVLLLAIFALVSVSETYGQKTPRHYVETIEKLLSDRALDRGRAARSIKDWALEGHDVTATTPVLIDLLGDESALQWEVRSSSGVRTGTTTVGKIAADALAAIGEPALDPVIAFLAQVDDNEQSAAYRNTVDVIASLAEEDTVPRAVDALLRQFEKGVDEPLVNALLQFDRGEGAVRSKLRRGTESDRVVILDLLNSFFAWPEKREDVESVLKRRSWEYEALLSALEDDVSPSVRETVASGMSDWSVSKYPQALESLVHVLEHDPSPAVRAKATYAVLDTTFFFGGEGIYPWTRPKPRVMAYLDLTVPSLISVLSDESQPVRVAAASCLESLFDELKRRKPTPFSKASFDADVPEVGELIPSGSDAAMKTWSAWWEQNRA